MQPQDRLAFSPIDTRPPLKLPDGLRLILWPLMSLEQWDISRPMARMVITPPQGAPIPPNADLQFDIHVVKVVPNAAMMQGAQ